MCSNIYGGAILPHFLYCFILMLTALQSPVESTSYPIITTETVESISRELNFIIDINNSGRVVKARANASLVVTEEDGTQVGTDINYLGNPFPADITWPLPTSVKISETGDRVFVYYQDSSSSNYGYHVYKLESDWVLDNTFAAAGIHNFDYGFVPRETFQVSDDGKTTALYVQNGAFSVISIRKFDDTTSSWGSSGFITVPSISNGSYDLSRDGNRIGYSFRDDATARWYVRTLEFDGSVWNENHSVALPERYDYLNDQLRMTSSDTFIITNNTSDTQWARPHPYEISGSSANLLTLADNSRKFVSSMPAPPLLGSFEVNGAGNKVYCNSNSSDLSGNLYCYTFMNLNQNNSSYVGNTYESRALVSVIASRDLSSSPARIFDEPSGLARWSEDGTKCVTVGPRNEDNSVLALSVFSLSLTEPEEYQPPEPTLASKPQVPSWMKPSQEYISDILDGVRPQNLSYEARLTEVFRNRDVKHMTVNSNGTVAYSVYDAQTSLPLNIVRVEKLDGTFVGNDISIPTTSYGIQKIELSDNEDSVVIMDFTTDTPSGNNNRDFVNARITQYKLVNGSWIALSLPYSNTLHNVYFAVTPDHSTLFAEEKFGNDVKLNIKSYNDITGLWDEVDSLDLPNEIEEFNGGTNFGVATSWHVSRDGSAIVIGETNVNNFSVFSLENGSYVEKWSYLDGSVLPQFREEEGIVVAAIRVKDV